VRRDVTVALPSRPAASGAVLAGRDLSLPFVVVDGEGAEVPAVCEFLRELMAGDCAPSTCRSYAFDLLRWFRLLAAVGVGWEQAGRGEVREMVVWLRTSENPQRRRSDLAAPAAGSVNERTGKARLAGGYAPATINHALSVVASFYEFHISQGRGPLLNPVPAPSRRGARVHAHHNPLEAFGDHRRAPYRQKQSRAAPRSIPDDLFDELFAALRCHRDRAIVSLYVSSGARASELLGVCGANVHWGQNLVSVVTKGSRALEQVPASPDAFVWLALYLAESPLAGPDQPLWWARRSPRRPLNYMAMRAVLGRANAELGTNFTLHDLRHTCAARLVRDPAMTLSDVQAVLRHRHLSSTEIYTRARLEDIVERVQAHYARPAPTPAPAPAPVYDPACMRVVFGEV
jgi:integrase